MVERFRKSFWLKSAAAALTVACAALAVVLVAFPETPDAGRDAARPDGDAQQLADESPAAFYGGDFEVAYDDGIFDGAAYVDGVVLVDLVDWTTPDEASMAFESASGLDGFVAGPASGNYVAFRLPAGLSVAEALELLGSSELVGAVQPDFVYAALADGIGEDGAADEAGGSAGSDGADATGLTAARLVDSALTTQADGFEVNDPYAGQQWAIGAMNLAAAWKTAHDLGVVSDDATGVKRTVAVIDEGFLTTHEDLGAVVDAYNSYDGSSNVSPIQSDSHGTHVAGIVGARTNNGKGVAGVSYNAQLQLIKAAHAVGGSAYFTTESLAAGIERATSMSATLNTRVINISVGGYMGPVSEFDVRIKQAIDAAYKQGLVVVCSAGNADAGSGTKVPYVNYPSDYPTAVSVIGLGEDGSGSDAYARTSTSNYNMNANDWGKDVSAPGSGVMSLLKTAGNYGMLSGTSMASPHVAGVFSLVFAVEPGLSTAEAVDIVYATATDLNTSQNRAGTTFDDETGYGIVNAQAAVDAARAAIVKGGGTVQRGATTSLFVWPIASDTWSWTSSDTAVAKVSSTGVVTGVKEGVATVTARRSDGTTASRSITVYDPKASGSSKLEVGATGSSTITSSIEGSWTWSSSNAAIAQVDASTGKVVGKSAGTATITASLTLNPTITASYVVTVTTPAEKTPAQIERLAGATALDTMRTIVQAGGWKTGGTVVLVTADGYWDGLTANGVAGLAGAPIVMTDGAALSSQAKAVIAKLKPAKIVVCGGTAAVSSAVANAACAAAGTSPKLVRLWGAQADGTATKVFEGGPSAVGGSWSSTAFVCTDNGYWDALSAAPASYVAHMPIFLTRESGAQLSSETLEAMRKGGITGVYIVGGTAAVGNEAEAQLSSSGITVLGRLWGADAVDTSLKVAQFSLGLGLSADGFGVATSTGYWDALAGAALCGKNGSTLIIVDGPRATTIAGFAKANKADVEHAYIFGGVDAVSSATETALENALN